jgi:hypothetical protein
VAIFREVKYKGPIYYKVKNEIMEVSGLIQGG